MPFSGASLRSSPRHPINANCQRPSATVPTINCPPAFESGNSRLRKSGKHKPDFKIWKRGARIALTIRRDAPIHLPLRTRRWAGDRQAGAGRRARHTGGLMPPARRVELRIERCRAISTRRAARREPAGELQASLRRGIRIGTGRAMVNGAQSTLGDFTSRARLGESQWTVTGC